MNQDTRMKMERYVATLDRISNYGFLKRIMAQGGLHFNFRVECNHDEAKMISASHDHPTNEEVDAIILTARLLTQDNDAMSFANMARLCQDSGVSEEWKELFTRGRRMLNEYLNETWEVVISHEPLTNRVLFETIVYGDLAHKNPIKAVRVSEWKSEPFVWEHFYWGKFCSVLYDLLFIALSVAELCKLELNGEPITLPESN